MIVRNEASVIARCLASVRPVIDSWLVVDTGSQDGTQDIVRAVLADLPGELVESPWRDFAYNRSEALALARPRADYTLVIDADDELVIPAGAERPALNADSYVVGIELGGVAYHRTQVVRNALPWRYRGVLHEFLVGEGAESVSRLPWTIRCNDDGRRRQDPRTYAKDAALLQRALETEDDPFLISRYTFYLAQSWRDCGERARALEAYLARAELGFWTEEVFVSLYQAGKLMAALGYGLEEVLAVHARATRVSPGRAEAAHAGAHLCRLAGQFGRACDLARLARDLAAPADGLFVEQWIYDYGLLDELSVSTYWAGAYRDSLDAALTALSRGKVPADEASRFFQNMRFALEKL